MDTTTRAAATRISPVEKVTDWRRKMSDNIAYALLVYTALQIGLTIGALKTKVSQAYEEVQNQRDKEEKQREKIQQLRNEIATLKLKALEEVELSEEETLKNLREQYEDLCKVREEQEERMERVR